MHQYPHTIAIPNQTSFDQDGNGNFQPTNTALDFTSQCRCEVAKDDPVITGPDGASLKYNWVIYMPILNMVIPFGTELTVTTPDGIFNSTLKRQETGTFNTKLWV